MDNIVPSHVAIIMDGNGRWATERGLSRSAGHLEGSKTLDKICTYAFNRGIKILSVFAFSTENFKRSGEEVNYLMNLFIKTFKKYRNKFNEENIKVVFSSHDGGLGNAVREAMHDLEESTKNNTRAILNICLNYGGHIELVDAVQKIVDANIKVINEKVIEDNLYQVLPPIDLLIRTSGEYRISNFMLWQLAYSEFYFTDTYFPAFTEAEFEEAISSYSKRHRRFGGNETK